MAPKSTRPPSSDMPAGLESTLAASRVAPTPTPPIEFCTGPKPIIRMPLVACAGVAMARASAAAKCIILVCFKESLPLGFRRFSARAVPGKDRK